MYQKEMIMTKAHLAQNIGPIYFPPRKGPVQFARSLDIDVLDTKIFIQCQAFSPFSERKFTNLYLMLNSVKSCTQKGKRFSQKFQILTQKSGKNFRNFKSSWEGEMIAKPRSVEHIRRGVPA